MRPTRLASVSAASAATIREPIFAPTSATAATPALVVSGTCSPFSVRSPQLFGSPAKILGDRQTDVEPDRRHEQGELLVANPRDDVRGAHLAIQDLGESLQRPIAFIPTKAVVDETEVIEIEHHQHAAFAAALQQCLRGPEKRHPIGQTGQSIHVRRFPVEASIPLCEQGQHGHDEEQREE